MAFDVHHLNVGHKARRTAGLQINDAVIASGLCRSQLYNFMRDGRLPFVEVADPHDPRR